MGGIVGLLAGSFAALVGIILAVRFVRRWSDRRPIPQQPAFDQAELHAMLAAGQITPAEFERLKVLVLAQQPTVATNAPRGPHGFEPLPRPPGPAPDASPDAGNPPAGR
jgi:hypothetical protein